LRIAKLHERIENEAPVNGAKITDVLWLDPVDQPARKCQAYAMKRVIVLGNSCAGKTTFAVRLSKHLNSKHIELDALFWEANWKEADNDVFRSRVADELTIDTWIVDGNYRSKLKDLVWPYADTVIWLDPSLSIVLVRFLLRSLRRSFTGEVLWGGCKESLRNSIFQRNSLLAWILKTHNKRSKDYLKLVEKPSPGVTVHRLRTSKDIEIFFTNLKQP